MTSFACVHSIYPLTHSSTNIINISSPAFADDLAIICLYPRCLERLLSIAYEYSRTWQFEFNASKSAILSFGKGYDQYPRFQLGNQEVQIEKASTHMGVIITDHPGKQEEFIRDKCSAGMRVFHSYKGIGSCKNPVPPLVLSKLYWNVSVPKIVYGAEVLDLSNKSIDRLESTHSSAAKQIQGLPPRTANIGSITALGWSPIQMRIDAMRMLFLWKILLLPCNNIYKKVLLIRLFNHLFKDGIHLGPTICALNTFRKYDLEHVLIDALCHGSTTHLIT